MEEIRLYGNPMLFLEENDGILYVSYDKVYVYAERGDESTLVGLSMLIQSFLGYKADKDYDKAYEVLEVISDVFNLLFSVSKDLEVFQKGDQLFNFLLSNISNDEIIIFMSMINDYMDSLDYDYLRQNESEFLVKMALAANLGGEIHLRNKNYLLKDLGYIGNVVYNLNNALQKIIDKKEEPYIDLHILLEDKRKSLLGK